MATKTLPIVVFYNHNDFSLDISSDMLRSSQWQLEDLSDQSIRNENILNAQLAIGHGANVTENCQSSAGKTIPIDKWADLQKQPLRLVIVTLSSQQLVYQPKINSNGSILLWAQDTKGDNLAIDKTRNNAADVKKKWQELMPLLLDYEAISEWVKEKKSYLILDKFFRKQVSKGYCIALSIWCQGFLAEYVSLPSVVMDAEQTQAGCPDLGVLLRAMGLIQQNGSQLEIAKELESEQKENSSEPGELEDDDQNDNILSKPDPEPQFWELPYAQGKTLRQLLEYECRLLREKVLNQINTNWLDWPEGNNLPTRIDALVKLIENKKASVDTNYASVVAQAYQEVNFLLGTND
jgi:hypothetical protein